MKKHKKIIFLTTLIIFSIVFAIAITSLVKYNQESEKSESTFDDLREIYTNPDKTDIGFDNFDNPDDNKLQALRELNPDCVGWITIEGTDIDYPVMQNKEQEEFYLHKDFYKNYSFAGVPYCSARSNLEKPSDNIMIFGHSMLNGTMFNQLHSFFKKDFYDEYKYILFDNYYHRNSIYEIVYVARVDISKENINDVLTYHNGERAFEKFKEFLESHKIYDTGVDLKYGDKTLTLLTCTRYYNYSTNGRIIIVAKQIAGG